MRRLGQVAAACRSLVLQVQQAPLTISDPVPTVFPPTFAVKTTG